MGVAKQATVRVDGEMIEVWIAQTGKVTWRAWATFRGKPLEANGTSQGNAIDKWQLKADYVAKA